MKIIIVKLIYFNILIIIYHRINKFHNIFSKFMDEILSIYSLYIYEKKKITTMKFAIKLSWIFIWKRISQNISNNISHSFEDI